MRAADLEADVNNGPGVIAAFYGGSNILPKAVTSPNYDNYGKYDYDNDPIPCSPKKAFS